MAVKKKASAPKVRTLSQVQAEAKKLGIALQSNGKKRTKNVLAMMIGKKKSAGSAKPKSKQSATAKSTRLYQTGPKPTGYGAMMDKMIKAKPPGKRTTAHGTTYYERRANRSDMPGSLMDSQRAFSQRAFNGYSNWETWNWALNFLSDYQERLAEDIRQGDLNRNDFVGTTNAYEVGEYVKEDFESYLYDTGIMPTDNYLEGLINASLQDINWTEIGELIAFELQVNYKL